MSQLQQERDTLRLRYKKASQQAATYEAHTHEAAMQIEQLQKEVRVCVCAYA